MRINYIDEYTDRKEIERGVFLCGIHLFKHGQDMKDEPKSTQSEWSAIELASSKLWCWIAKMME